MQQALMLAKRGCLSVSPNPMVGCVIVKKGRIIGQGWHMQPGKAHAEINALANAKASVEGATAYVTLEPCCHHGKTGPCTQALIEAKIARVVIATLDPNPKVQGKGVKALQSKGIDVKIGVLVNEAKVVNKIFFYYQAHHKPYVIGKWALSLDGYMNVSPGDSKAISGKSSQKEVHDLRNICDAIIVGKGTILEDDPQLTVRESSSVYPKHPLRVIISTTANLPLSAKVFNCKKAQTILFTSTLADEKRLNELQVKGVECVVLPVNEQQQISMNTILLELAKRGVTSVLVEGGRMLHQAFFKEGLVNEVHSYMAPFVIGGFSEKQPVNVDEIQCVGRDLQLIAQFRR